MIAKEIQSLPIRIKYISGRLLFPDNINRKYENLLLKRNVLSIYNNAFINNTCINKLMEKI